MMNSPPGIPSTSQNLFICIGQSEMGDGIRKRNLQGMLNEPHLFNFIGAVEKRPPCVQLHHDASRAPHVDFIPIGKTH